MGLEQHSSQQEINMPYVYCGRGNARRVISFKRYKQGSATSPTQIESQSHALTHTLKQMHAECVC